LLNWTNGPDHSMAEKAVPVERDEGSRNVKYLLVGTNKIAAPAGSTDRPSSLTRRRSS
jgi:hypothetical protein